MADLIQKIKDRNEFDYLDDGYLYYFPSNKGGLNSAELRVIADHLDKMNLNWHTQIMNNPNI